MNAAITPEECAVLAAPGIRHGFFTRRGGVSTGVYASLNCGLGSADDQAAIRENRDRAGAWLAGKPAAVSTAYQIHSATAAVIDAPLGSDLPKADALVTATPGVVVGALAADCTPVLLADPNAGVVAAAHAGWRGAIDGVVASAVTAMEGLGARRADIRAAIGPCIGQASYEVGLEFEATFLERTPGNARYFAPGKSAAKRQFDLSRFVTESTQALGLAEVGRLDIDVYAAPDRFFSYRRSQHEGAPDYARLLSAIVLA